MIKNVLFSRFRGCWEFEGFPCSSVARICMKCRRPGFDLWVGKIPWKRKWQPIPASLPGKSHGHRSRVGCSPWRIGCDLFWHGERGIVLPTTNKNGRIICLICNLMSKSVVSTLSVRICSHPKEIPKIKAYFILILHHSVTQSDKAVIISFFACCHWENKKVLVSCESFSHQEMKTLS